MDFCSSVPTNCTTCQREVKCWLVAALASHLEVNPGDVLEPLLQSRLAIAGRVARERNLGKACPLLRVHL